jgi:predicted O-methyltransferase YrrM
MIYHLSMKKLGLTPKRTNKKSGPALFSVIHYSFTLFLGSFLLFLLEPLYAKFILPWFGGASSVWALCLAFFQFVLLQGYWYADFTTKRLRPWPRSLIHIGLLLSCLWLMPITLNPQERPLPGANPVFLILGLLITRIGLPFFLLSASSPLIQSWYARRLPAKKPYVLFALSNAASLLGLLSFIFLVEPNLSSKNQASLWSWLFIVYVAACSLAAWNNRHERTSLNTSRQGPQGPRPPLAWREKLLWVALSASGSMLLLSITNHITQDVAPIPLLWVLPLSLYLLSFIWVFSHEGLYPRRWAALATAVALILMNYAFYEPGFLPTLQLKLLVLGTGLFIGCLFCHGELACRKPAAPHLTTYYLMISLGGALGAVFVGLAAPQIFSSVVEYPLSLIFISGIALLLLWQKGLFTRTVWGIITVFLILVFAWNTHVLQKESLVMVRNFYAPLRVVLEETRKKIQYLTLCNGVIVHGKQFLNPSQAMEGTTYYSRDSGAGLAIRLGRSGAKRIGLIGLGAGTLAVYGRPGDLFRFYEINPQVIEIAKNYFSFLRDCPAKVEIVPGDARLSLESELPNRFDVLAVDAFSGDAVPVHLLTKEAFALYLSHLKPDGILAFHTSNLHLLLAPVVKRLADDAGYLSIRVTNKSDDDRLIDWTDWVLVTKKKSFIRMLQNNLHDTEILVPADIPLWTDDYNSLYTILR